MPLYRYCGHSIQSSLVLKGLPEVVGGTDFTFEVAAGLSAELLLEKPFHEVRVHSGRVVLSVGRFGAGYWLRFSDSALFLVTADATTVRCYPAEGTQSDVIEHLLLNQVVPVLLGHRGNLVLHASAAIAPGGAVAFMAETGQGKSTLSAYLASQGWPLLTDDCLLLREQGNAYLAVPSCPSVRLWPAGLEELALSGSSVLEVVKQTEKRCLHLADRNLPFAFDPVPVRRIYVLCTRENARENDGVSLSPLSPQERFMELAACSFQLDLIDTQAVRNHFRRLGLASQSLQMTRLSYPRIAAVLPEVMKVVLADSSTGFAGGG